MTCCPAFLWIVSFAYLISRPPSFHASSSFSAWSRWSGRCFAADISSSRFSPSHSPNPPHLPPVFAFTASPSPPPYQSLPRVYLTSPFPPLPISLSLYLSLIYVVPSSSPLTRSDTAVSSLHRNRRYGREPAGDSGDGVDSLNSRRRQPSVSFRGPSRSTGWAAAPLCTTARAARDGLCFEPDPTSFCTAPSTGWSERPASFGAGIRARTLTGSRWRSRRLSS